MMDSEHIEAGLVTLPAEDGLERETLEIARRWQADAVRNSDGTQLSDEIRKAAFEVYSTVCFIREDQAWARAHRGELIQRYLLSPAVTAVADMVEIDLLKPYFREQFAIDRDHDPSRWWEVIDRTSGAVVAPSAWTFDPAAATVSIAAATPWHVYTVSFLVYQIWDPTSMYNQITNGWQTEHALGVNPYLPAAGSHLLARVKAWLANNPDTDVVRLTSLFYHFTITYNQAGREIYTDWLGYSDCVSPRALDDFEREKGYRLRPEDLVDEGYYNACSRVPSQACLDWIDFNHRFTIAFGKEVVAAIHAAGKRAMLFLGDHWIGAEPYSPLFAEMKLDGVIGAVADGVQYRLLADIPGDLTREMRLFPYFFPDVFKPGGDPTGISRANWVKIRRALLRKSVDRIGYGGYLSLILPFPGFVDHVEALCGEFREILSNTRKTPPYSAGFKVVVLNAWGRSRSWIQPILWPSKFPRSDVMESLAGMRFDVAFMSFDELSATGVPDDVGVVVNLGDAGTAWSGGRHWGDSRVVAALRRFVHAGGGFVGVSAPTAHEWQGRCFQLSDVLGVQKETGLSQTSAPCAAETVARHYILEDLDGAPDLGPYRTTHVYASDEATEVLMRHEGHVLLAAHRFGRGRSVYLAGLPYSHNNTRLLDRILFWAAGREEAQRCWSSSNPGTECAFYPETNRLVVVNNTGDEQRTTIMGDCGRSREISLQPYQCIWMTGA